MGGSAPRTPRPVSDDDTVDNFSCRRIGVFSIFSNFERIEKNGPCLTYDYRDIEITKLYLYKLYYYKNFFLFPKVSYLKFDKDSKNVILFTYVKYFLRYVASSN